MPAEIHVGDVGTEFIATIRDELGGLVDPSLASTRQMRFKKPDGTIVTKPAALVTDGSDGKMKYISVTNDLDTAGSWQVQGYVEIGSGKWSSDVHRFRVYANLS